RSKYVRNSSLGHAKHDAIHTSAENYFHIQYSEDAMYCANWNFKSSNDLLTFNDKNSNIVN
ncbi:MAG: hypothetical protein OER96_02535, partial [Gammaproteobacteria bacterium]|nr:hypothetical protein [Gammaproteobacteria bacterium]